MVIYPWTQVGSNIPTAATITSSAAVQVLASAQPRAGYNVRVTNDGTTVAHVRFGDAAVGAATTADIPIVPGTERILVWPGDATHYRVIMKTGTANVDVSLGFGV